jgi:long-chain acyl-CoA synthetase
MVSEVCADLGLVFGEYEWRTYKEVYDDTQAFARYLIKHDLAPKQDTADGEFRFISLYAKNRDEWAVTDLGAMLTSITVVTLYDTLGKDSIDYILN